MFSRCLHITSFCTLEHWINVRSAAICSSLTRDRANEERSEAQNYHITRRFWAWEASNESSEIKIPLSGIMTILHREPVTTFEPNRIELGFRWLAEKSFAIRKEYQVNIGGILSLFSLSLSFSRCRPLLPLASPNRCIYVRLIDSTSSSRRSDVPRRSGNTGEKVAIPLSTWLEINGSGQRWSLFSSFSSSSSSSSSSFSLLSVFPLFRLLEKRLADPLYELGSAYFHNSVLRRRVRSNVPFGIRGIWKIKVEKEEERTEFVDWKLKFEGTDGGDSVRKFNSVASLVVWLNVFS